MHDDVASQTAMRVALQRAAHQLLDTRLSSRTIVPCRSWGPGAEERLRGAAAEYRTPFARALRAAVVARAGSAWIGSSRRLRAASGR
jgi:hypothetical protein